jgi:hypothetical protein
MHFSDKLSYKILFISSYGLKYMSLARFAYLQEFQKTEKKTTTRAESGPDLWRRIESVARGRRVAPSGSGTRPSRGAGCGWWVGPTCQFRIRIKKVGNCSPRDSNLDLQELAKGIRPLCCSYESEHIRKGFIITWLQEVETDETEDNLTPVLRLDTIRNRVSPRVFRKTELAPEVALVAED